MAHNQEPVVLELAPLPREQIGPFLLLGVDKDADREEIEANWARRVIWARKQQSRIALEDINWAREVINDAERRVRADAASLNADTSEAVLRRISRRYGGQGGLDWQPLDVEKPLEDYTPAVEVPDPQAVLADITVPAVPEEVPAVAGLLKQLAAEPLDPWALALPEPENEPPALRED
jgi:hypothetical protein